MGFTELIAATAGLLLFLSRTAVYIWPDAVRTLFNKNIVRRSQTLFNAVAVIALIAGLYLLTLLLSVTSLGIMISSAVAAGLLVVAWLAYNSDLWKQFAQIILKKPTPWLKLNSAIDAIIGLLILLLTIGRI